GATGEFAAPDGATSGGAVNTVFTASGSLTITSCMPLGKNVSVKNSPSVRAQRSINHVGASAHASVCAIGGAFGPGGSRAPPRPSGTVCEREASDGASAPAAPEDVAVAMATRYRHA